MRNDNHGPGPCSLAALGGAGGYLRCFEGRVEMRPGEERGAQETVEGASSALDNLTGGGGLPRRSCVGASDVHSLCMHLLFTSALNLAYLQAALPFCSHSLVRFLH